jgi:hypothetical protein
MIGRLGRCKSCGVTTEIRPAAVVAGVIDVYPATGAELEPEQPALIVEVVPAHKHVSIPRQELGREPWYYRLLVQYAYAIVVLGALAAVGVGVVMGVTFSSLHLGRRVDPLTAVREIVTVALVVAGILTGSGLVAAPILLAVDAARKLRLLCAQGMVR